MILIIGAGPCGLGAAKRLVENGRAEWELLEGQSVPGGLAASFVDSKGFTWDIGGHVQFSHYDYFDKAMLDFLGEDGWFHHERESWVWIKDRFVPYPFQNNIRHLPPEDLQKCLQGLEEVARNPKGKPENFLQWINTTFGAGLAEIFMKPYNFKQWAFPPELMNIAWMGERVSVVDLARVMRNIERKHDDISWGPNNKFQFPKHGGTGAVWRACASQLPQDKLHFNQRVVAIDLKEHRCTTEDGAVHEYEQLISTLPLNELIRISGQHQLKLLADRGLLYSSSNIIGLGLSGKPADELAKKCWMYFPESNCPFYRVTVFSNYSPYNVPDINKNWSLMLEVSESQYKPVDQNRLMEDVIQGALDTKLISSRDEIVSTWRYRAEYGYPIPGLNRDEALSELIPFFEKHDVYPRGRFGLWKYEVSNQDHSFMQGVEIVERLINNSKEITAYDPNYVNSRKNPWPHEAKT